MKSTNIVGFLPWDEAGFDFDEIMKGAQKAIEEAAFLKKFSTPSAVHGGAVWADRYGKLTGDIQTNSGSVSFSGGMVGPSIPPDPQLDMHVPFCVERLDELRERICMVTELEEPDEALNHLAEIREELEACLDLAQRKIALLTRQLEAADLVKPDTDPVRRVTNVVARYVPDDGPLSCDPDEHPNG